MLLGDRPVFGSCAKRLLAAAQQSRAIRRALSRLESRLRHLRTQRVVWAQRQHLRPHHRGAVPSRQRTRPWSPSLAATSSRTQRAPAGQLAKVVTGIVTPRSPVLRSPGGPESGRPRSHARTDDRSVRTTASPNVDRLISPRGRSATTALPCLRILPLGQGSPLRRSLAGGGSRARNRPATRAVRSSRLPPNPKGLLPSHWQVYNGWSWKVPWTPTHSGCASTGS